MVKGIKALLFLAGLIFYVGCNLTSDVKTSTDHATSTVAPAFSLPLWPQGAPEENCLSGPEKEGTCVGNISEATLTAYLPEPDRATGAGIVVIPGGGYGVVCLQTEGQAIADLLVPRGIAAFVLKYRLPNTHHRIPSMDARRALRTVRFHAEEWHVDPNRIGVWGFSAGGHLASTVTTVFDRGTAGASDPIERQSSQPDFAILFYPVISMKSDVTHQGSRNNLIGSEAPASLVERYSNENRITSKTPPTLLLHCSDDRVVPVENSLRFYQGLVREGISTQMLIFEKGGHGPSAFNLNPSWLTAWEKWLQRRGCLESE